MNARTEPTTLAQHPCQQVCAWAPTGTRRDGLPLFRCSGCGSEWVRAQAWTPAAADGQVSPAVAAEAARRAGPATNGPGADGAGSAGS
jgi:hypothetical protein